MNTTVTQAPTQVIEAQRTDKGIAFELPFDAATVAKMEAVDLDLLITLKDGQQFILTQAGLLAMTQPESVLRYAGGLEVLAADEVKQIGAMQSMDANTLRLAGNFRLASLEMDENEIDRVSGTGFGLGQELVDITAKLDQSSQKIEQMLQSLEQATQASNLASSGDEPPPAVSTGVKRLSKNTNPDLYSSPTPGTPPELVKKEEQTNQNTSNNTNNNDNNNTSTADAVTPKISISLLAANKSDVSFQDVALNKTEVRQLLGKSSVELTMNATAQSLQFEAGKVENQLLLESVPTTTALLININNQQPGFKIPDGLTINGQAITPGTPLSLDVTGMKDNEVPLNLQWEEGAAAAASTFQMTVSYVGPNGETTLKTITFTGNAENAYTLDANGDPRQFITSQANNLVVKANDLANTITTGNGNDTIYGSGGADTINGGAGTDTVDYSGTNVAVILNAITGVGTAGQAAGDQLSNIERVVGSTATTDTLDFRGAASGVTVDFVNGTTNVGLSFSGFENAIGGDQDDSLTGNTLDNKLEGGKGDDTLIGGAGADSLIGGEGRDTASYAGANSAISIDMVNLEGSIGVPPSDADGDVLISIEHLIGTSKIDTLDFSKTDKSVTVNFSINTTTIDGKTGLSFDSFEKAIGGQGDDLFMGGDGGQQIDGGRGNDTVSYAGSSKVTVSLAGGIPNTGGHAQGDVLSNIENLIGGDQGDSLTGNTLDNKLEGGMGNDTLMGGGGADTLMGGDNDDLLIGGAGADSLNGGDGRDTASYAGANSPVTIDMVNLKGIIGDDPSDADGDVLVSIEHLIGTSNIDTLDFSKTDKSVTVDFINGTTTIGVNPGMSFSSFEKAIGGKGNDTYVVNNSAPIIEDTGGTDTVESSAHHTLAVNIENLILKEGSGNINGTGNTGNNNILGNSGNNVLVGGAGDDTLNGGGGNDTASYTTSSADITANLELGSATGEGTDVLINIENLQGGRGKDTLTGNSVANRLDGGLGADSMTGGLGDDIYVVDNTGDVVTEAADEGTDTVQSSITYILGENLENLTLSGSNAINGTGNSANNILTGNSSANRLDGGLGADTMAGGAGDDTYVVDNTNDKVTESDTPGAGTDTVEASVTYTLSANVENLTLTGGANLDGKGNGSNNTITGNSGNNLLEGEGGNDTLIGDGGNDTLLGGAGSDVLVVESSDLNSGKFDGGNHAVTTDTLKITASASATIDLTGINNANFVSIEKIDLTETTGNTVLKLNLETIKSLVDISSGTPNLIVKLGSGDTIDFVASSGQTTFNDTKTKEITVFGSSSSSSSLTELATISYA